VIVLLLLLVVLLVGLTAALVVGRLGSQVEGMADATSTQGHVALPPGPVGPDDLERIGFDRAVRGYRMDQVDDVIDRLRDELRERDELSDRAVQSERDSRDAARREG